MDVSSNKRYFIDLKANEALTGVTTRFTDNENFNNFEKKVRTTLFRSMYRKYLILKTPKMTIVTFLKFHL